MVGWGRWWSWGGVRGVRVDEGGRGKFYFSPPPISISPTVGWMRVRVRVRVNRVRVRVGKMVMARLRVRVSPTLLSLSRLWSWGSWVSVLVVVWVVFGLGSFLF